MNDLPLLASAAEVFAILAPAVVVAILRIIDVTLNVFRTVFTVNGRKGLAALFHGLEGAAWLAAAGIVFADLTPVRMAGFVVGVMAGTFLGTTIIERLRLGHVTVRVFVDTKDNPGGGLRVADAIHHAGFGATTFDGAGFHGPVQMVLATVRRRDAERVVQVARDVRDDVFVAVDNERLAMPAGGRV